jgi:ADP-ribose pyrophosphatase
MKWEIADRELLYSGFFRLSRLRLAHALFEGGMSPELERELIERGHAAAVLPYDAPRDRVVLIEQFRVGAIESPRGPWTTEIVAGLMESGESAEAVGRREAGEEAGCELGELVRAHQYYSSPGGSTERITVFVAQVDSRGIGGLHGRADEGEDIRVRVVDFEEAMGLVASGVIDSAMPIIALQWLALNRADLRARWSD